MANLRVERNRATDATQQLAYLTSFVAELDAADFDEAVLAVADEFEDIARNLRALAGRKERA